MYPLENNKQGSQNKSIVIQQTFIEIHNVPGIARWKRQENKVPFTTLTYLWTIMQVKLITVKVLMNYKSNSQKHIVCVSVKRKEMSEESQAVPQKAVKENQSHTEAKEIIFIKTNKQTNSHLRIVNFRVFLFFFSSLLHMTVAWTSSRDYYQELFG